MPVLAMGVMVLCIGAPVWADMSLTPSSAMTFQDDPDPSFETVDNFTLLTTLDGQWAPSPVPGFPRYNYYATGSSNRWWDAVSLNFDLSSMGWEHVASASLRFYTQQGSYSDTGWHHYEVLEGAFDDTDQDRNMEVPPWPGVVDFGSGFVGWLSEPIPLSWITGDSFDVTLRLWNARIDAVELNVVRAPLPGAVLLGLLGFGTAGSGLLLRRFGT
jgi:hypothetical protein